MQNSLHISCSVLAKSPFVSEELPVTWLIALSYAHHWHKEPEILPVLGIEATLCTFLKSTIHCQCNYLEIALSPVENV